MDQPQAYAPPPKPKPVHTLGLAHLLNFNEHVAPESGSDRARKRFRLAAILPKTGSTKRLLMTLALVGATVAAVSFALSPARKESTSGTAALKPMTCNPALQCPEGSIECVRVSQHTSFIHPCTLKPRYSVIPWIRIAHWENITKITTVNMVVSAQMSTAQRL